MNKPLVSIVIPTKDRLEDIKKLLLSINNSKYKNYEIIIINNGNNDLSLDISTEKVQVINNKFNVGLAKARNQGAKLSKGKYVLFIDDDNIIDKDLLKNLVDSFESNPEFIAVGPLTKYWGNKKKIWFVNAEYSFLTTRFTIVKSLKKVSLYKKRFVYTDNLHNCLMIPKELGDKVGWFDEKLFMSGTEFDLLQRLRTLKPSGVLVTDISAISYHNIPLPSKKGVRHLGISYPFRAFYLQRNRAVLLKRYGNFFYVLILGLITYPLFFLFYTYRFIRAKRLDLVIANFKGVLAGYIFLFFNKLCAVY